MLHESAAAAMERDHPKRKSSSMPELPAHPFRQTAE